MMAYQGFAGIICSRCGASYDSDATLRQHMASVHREGASEPGTSQNSATEGTEPGSQGQDQE